MFNPLRDEQLRLLWLSRIDYDQNSGVDTHNHEDFYQLLLVINGTGKFHLESDVFDIHLNRCYLIPPTKNHKLIFKSKTNTIDFKFKVFNEKLNQLLLEELSCKPISCQSIERFKQLFQLTTKNLKQPNSLIPYQIEIGLKELLISLIIENKSSDPKLSNSSLHFSEDSPIKPIIDFFKNHIDEDLNLEILSKHFGFHPHYIIQLFNKDVGNSPMKVLQVLRMEKAKEYLEFTSFTVNEIAEKIGLSTPYFSRLFKERERLSPSQYRTQSRAVVGKDIILAHDFTTTFQIQPQIRSL